MFQVLLIILAITPVSAVFFIPIYCISHLLESTTPFSLVLLFGRFSYQLPISGPSFSVAIVSATA